MKNKKYNNSKMPLILVASIFVLFFACNKIETETEKGEKTNISVDKNSENSSQETDQIAVESPPFSEDIFPCSYCHADFEPNPVRRELVDMHDDITAMFNHDSENRWCLDCHDLNNRDSLKLANGKLLDFKESYKLCGQCHGDKLRDWKVGVHGKRIGEWNGKKQYLLCVHCHNPHSPKFKQIKPLPPPVRQEDIY